MNDQKKYWHELEQSEIDAIPFETPVQQVIETYLQPDWCGYADAIHPTLGCWSLTGDETRTRVSHEFCKGCECYKPKT